MKKIIIAAVFLIVGISTQIKAETDITFGGDFGFFYSSLSPYGNWIQINGGVNVWRPWNVRDGWAPYRYGHWIWTNDGWYWDSDEPYGYIVYHYGRWYYDDYYGWIWVPDYQWAPAWVEWRYDNDYIGWAPLPPYASFSVGFGISFTSSYYTPYQYYSFVSYRYMCNPHVYNYYVNDSYKYRIYSGTKFRTNYGYSDGRVINRGVDVDFIRQRSGDRIVERKIDGVNDPRNFRGRSSNSNVVRSLILPKEQIDRGTGRNIQIQRGGREASLDVSRIAVGNRNDISRNMNYENRDQTNFNRNRIGNGSNNRPNNSINQSNNQNNVDRQRVNNREQNNGWFFNNQKRNTAQPQQRESFQQPRREPQQRTAPQVKRSNPGRVEMNRGGGNRNNSDNRRHR